MSRAAIDVRLAIRSHVGQASPAQGAIRAEFRVGHMFDRFPGAIALGVGAKRDDTAAVGRRPAHDA